MTQLYRGRQVQASSILPARRREILCVAVRASYTWARCLCAKGEVMRFAGMFAAVIAIATGSAQADVAVYTKGGVQIVSNAALGPNERRGLSKFKQRARDFNGAFYVSSTGDHGEWWVDEHRLDDAKAIAKANCEANDGVSGSCSLYAVIVPAGNPVGGGKLVKNINAGLSRDLARSSSKGAVGSYGAAAANRVAKYGMSWGQTTREAARKDALLQCLRSIEQGGGRDIFSKYVSSDTYRRLLGSGRFDCKLVAEWQQ
jgi:hypothetical protein